LTTAAAHDRIRVLLADLKTVPSDLLGEEWGRLLDGIEELPDGTVEPPPSESVP
jgi:hypothetical protein